MTPDIDQIALGSIPLHLRNSLLVILVMIPTSFTIVSSIFQIPNNIFTLLSCSEVLCECLTYIISQQSVG